MRLLLDNNSRTKLFEKLKELNGTVTNAELAKRLGVSVSCLKKWRSGKSYVPESLVPSGFQYKLIDKQNENWGCVKGGKTGVKAGGNPLYAEAFKLGGKKAAKKLRRWIADNKSLHNKAIRRGKIQKALREVERNTKVNESYFRSKEITLNTSKVSFSKNDVRRNIILPKSLTPMLAEEIGVHIGDGTLPNKKYYFSVRGGYDEEKYYTDYLFDLYKKLYGIKLNLIKRYDACGFELGSKAIFEFKSKVLGLPIGEKIYRIRVPKIIFESRNKEIFRALLRGVFDTDGCVYGVPKKKFYPKISIMIKSEPLIRDLQKMLGLLGFKPAVYKYVVVLNGPVMFKKWLEEIGSSNPKHLQRIERLRKLMGPSSSLDLIAE